MQKIKKQFQRLSAGCRVTAVLLLAMAGMSSLFAENHYLEAENFKGNGYLANDASASGGKIVTGKTWYVLVQNVPIPEQPATGLFCFVRVRSDLKANWFLAYDTAKPFGWFSTPGDGRWVWVNIGKFVKSAENKGMMPQVFLQKPADGTAQTTDGAIDAIVFSETNDVKIAEELFSRQTEKQEAPAAASASDEEKARISELAAVQRVYGVKEAAAAPVLDGRLDDAVWQQAASAGDFLLLGGTGAAGQQSAVKVLQHQGNLYIGARLEEDRMPFLRRLYNQDCENVWTDDCFEVYLDPGLTRKRAFQFVINANGAKQDTLRTRIDEAGFSELNLNWKCAVVREEASWNVEICIPLKLVSFEEVKQGTVWGVNFCRSEIPNNEKSYWNNTGEYFLRPARYGLLHFGEVPGNLQGVLADGASGKLKLFFEPENSGVVKVQSGTREGGLKECDVTLDAGKQSIEQSIQGRGRYEVQVRLSQGGQTSCFAVDARSYQSGVLSCLWPCEERGNRLPLLYGTVQHAFWLFGNHTKQPVSGLEAILSLPEGIDILDPTTSTGLCGFYRRCHVAGKEPVTRDGKAYTRYTLAIEGDIGPNNLEKAPFYSGIVVFFKCGDASLIGTKQKIYSQIRTENLGEDENAYELEILPPVKAESPKTLVTHNWMWTFYPAAGSLEEYLKTLRSVGFNSVEADGIQRQPEIRKLFVKHGLVLRNNMFWHFNGDVPKEKQAVGYDGMPLKDSFCPTALLADDGRPLMENRAFLLKDIEEGSMAAIWDLEGPYCWKSCFCDNCREEFRKFARIDVSISLTPRKIRNDYNDAWIRFCCSQTSRMSKILSNAFHAVNPDAQFGWYSGLPSRDTMESYRADWLEAADKIDLALLSYYASSSSVLDVTFNDDMKKQIRTLKEKAGKHPLEVWATLTPGYGRNSSMNPPPELIKLEVLRAFASGMQGVSFWWWGPFDGDFYASFAEASNILAKYEPFFLAGEKEIPLKIRQASGKRYSTFTSRHKGRDLILILNHAASELTLTLDNQKSRTFLDEIAEKTFSGKSFSVTVPPSNAVVLISK